MSDLLVVGAGLIGTSVALAVRRDAALEVTLADRDPAVAEAAVARGAGRVWDGTERARLVVVATPPRRTAPVLAGLQQQRVGHGYTHVASALGHVQGELARLGAEPHTVVHGHPLAGSERSGPGAASADLFEGRPWALCPDGDADPAVVADVEELVRRCGARAVRMTPQEHDAAVALVSHLPQVAASALAGLLATANPKAVGIAGPGLADTTRIAGSSPALWGEILALNAVQVAPLVHRLAAELDGVATALDGLAAGDAGAAADRVHALLSTGNTGRARIPVKRGALDSAFATVVVVLDDRPGRLAALFADAGQAGVNIEDVRVEHGAGPARGSVELVVQAPVRDVLAAALQERGWLVPS